MGGRPMKGRALGHCPPASRPRAPEPRRTLPSLPELLLKVISHPRPRGLESG